MDDRYPLTREEALDLLNDPPHGFGPAVIMSYIAMRLAEFERPALRLVASNGEAVERDPRSVD